MISTPLNPPVIPVSDLHDKTEDLVRHVADTSEHLAVELNGERAVVMIPAQEYDAIMQERQERIDREERLRQFHEAAREIGLEAQRQGYTEEQMMTDLKETRRELFKEKYGDLEERLRAARND